MHQTHFRTERERLAAEKASYDAHRQKNIVDFESLLKNYPTKFDVAKCLSTERTFPACPSPIKAPVELETHMQLIKNQVIPQSKKKKKGPDDSESEQSLLNKATVSISDRNWNQTKPKMVSVIDSDSIGYGGLNTTRTNHTRQGETEQYSERKSTHGNPYMTGQGFNSVDMRTTADSIAADPLPS